MFPTAARIRSTVSRAVNTKRPDCCALLNLPLNYIVQIVGCFETASRRLFVLQLVGLHASKVSSPKAAVDFLGAARD